MSSRLFPGMPQIVFCSTACYLIVLFSHHSIKLCTMFSHIYFSLHSQLHFIKHGIYGQPGEESLLPAESRSTPWESTCTCIPEDSQSLLLIKWLNFQPSFQVYWWRQLIRDLEFWWSRIMTIPIGRSAMTTVKILDSSACYPILEKTTLIAGRRFYI